MKNLIEAVEKNRKLIIDAHEFIWHHPETGFKEWKTSEYLEKAYTDLGYKLVKADNIPGFYTEIDTGKSGPCLLILGELDSLICAAHADADPVTGAVHACGHSAQSAALLGIAAALKQSGAIDGMRGKIRLCAVPAEELIELDFRRELKQKGIIKYFTGKTEFLRRGYFDGVDLAFMVHTTSDELVINKGNVGCVAKSVVYKGKSAHAGGSPWSGCNALYAATQGLSAANAVREAFREQDLIRFHPIITEGGNAVNAVPDRVKLEAYVRGASFEAIREANLRINRALCGGALSLGANIEIIDMPGYSPIYNDPAMCAVAKQAAMAAFPDRRCIEDDSISTGSTDMGDLSALMPVVHPYVPGAKGITHGADYVIDDVEAACVGSAKWQLCMAHILLSDGAARANEIIKSFKPKFASKVEFFEMTDSFWSQGDRIVYGDNNAEIKL